MCVFITNTQYRLPIQHKDGTIGQMQLARVIHSTEGYWLTLMPGQGRTKLAQYPALRPHHIGQSKTCN